MNRHCIPGLTMSNSPMGTFCGSWGIIKNDAHRGLGRVHVLHYANALGADTEETGRYDLAWKDLCSVLNALK